MTNLTAQNGSFTSGVDVGRAVVTAAAGNPALVCAYLDQMYDPFQSHKTIGELMVKMMSLISLN